MATISQRSLFRWQEIEELGDLERLQLLVENLPDENLMRVLEERRGNGRNDYPLRPLWNSFLAGQIFQHASIESLRRELQRNGQLRHVCGFDPCRGLATVPPSYVYTRFLKLLFSCREQIDEMFTDLVAELQEFLPDFGNILAIDGKAIQSHGNARGKDADNTPDGRRDVDANWGTKTYKGKKADGTTWSKTKHWFGYKLHLIVDATYELPVAYKLTKASASEQPAGLALIKSLAQDQPDVIGNCEYLLGDKGYDGTKYHTQLWDSDFRIKSVIDIRNQWKDGEDERIVTGSQNVVYDHRGHVYCYCMKTGKRQDMAYGGFEKDRDCLKYLCPAKHYGLSCKSLGSCKVGHSVRIKLSEDRRVFTPVARSSYAWKTLYKMRTAVERVNGRLDTDFGFEDHYIRGQSKMELRVGLSLIVMLAMAVGRIKQKRPELMRSLVGDAA